VSGAAGILAAAGASTRFGSDKRLLPWRGSSLLRRAAEALCTVASPAVVVLPPGDAAGRGEIADLPVVAVENPAPEEGLGRSLAAGARALAEIGGFERILVVLVDQPRVDVELLQRLVVAARRTGWSASDYGEGLWGVPACLPATALGALRALTGDRGARPLLHPRLASGQLALVPFPGGALDVDTPDDYRTGET
jgi:molybdenum cofactor cytidylyltransferase